MNGKSQGVNFAPSSFVPSALGLKWIRISDLLQTTRLEPICQKRKEEFCLHLVRFWLALLGGPPRIRNGYHTRVQPWRSWQRQLSHLPCKTLKARRLTLDFFLLVSALSCLESCQSLLWRESSAVGIWVWGEKNMVERPTLAVVLDVCVRGARETSPSIYHVRVHKNMIRVIFVYAPQKQGYFFSSNLTRLSS